MERGSIDMRNLVIILCIILWIASPLITINILALTIKSIEYLRSKFDYFTKNK